LNCGRQACKRQAELLRRRPDNPRLLTEVGNSYYEDSSNLALGVIESEKYFRRSIKVAPEYGPAYVKLAKWYNSKGNFAEGIRLSTLGLNAKYPDHYGLVERAGAYSNLHKDKEALADMNKFIQRGNGEKVQILRRASIYENLHQYEKALADYKSVLKENYEDQVVFRELICLQELGRYDEALKEINKLIARNKIDDAGYLARARLYSKMGKPKEAISDFTRVIELAEATTIYKERAREYQKIGRKDLAARDLKSADRIAAEGM
jgi:tetratricopeptide (TPR) repeat protein